MKPKKNLYWSPQPTQFEAATIGERDEERGEAVVGGAMQKITSLMTPREVQPRGAKGKGQVRVWRDPGKECSSSKSVAIQKKTQTKRRGKTT